jgi:hypothetical protein
MQGARRPTQFDYEVAAPAPDAGYMATTPDIDYDVGTTGDAVYDVNTGARPSMDALTYDVARHRPLRADRHGLHGV